MVAFDGVGEVELADGIDSLGKKGGREWRKTLYRGKGEFIANVKDINCLTVASERMKYQRTDSLSEECFGSRKVIDKVPKGKLPTLFDTTSECLLHYVFQHSDGGPGPGL